MILTRLIRNILRTPSQDITTHDSRVGGIAYVLNVGGGSKRIPIPEHYNDWGHLLLDIAPGPEVDVVLDARQLATLEAEQFDAIYCSHNLEHYYRHDCAQVLAGFMHVLKPNGYAEIAVPDMAQVFETLVTDQLDIDDVLYVSPSGPITVHDVIYGLGSEIESSGVDFYAHKRGFTVKSLTRTLEEAGFRHVMTSTTGSRFNIGALAFKTAPTETQKAMFGL